MAETLSKDQFASIIFLGFAGQEVSDNAKALGSAAGSLDPALREHLEVLRTDDNLALMSDLAGVMYKAACEHLVSKGLAYPPFRPEVFLKMEAVIELSQRDRSRAS